MILHFVNETLGEVVFQKHSEYIKRLSIRIDEDSHYNLGLLCKFVFSFYVGMKPDT